MLCTVGLYDADWWSWFFPPSLSLSSTLHLATAAAAAARMGGASHTHTVRWEFPSPSQQRWRRLGGKAPLSSPRHKTATKFFLWEKPRCGIFFKKKKNKQRQSVFFSLYLLFLLSRNFVLSFRLNLFLPPSAAAAAASDQCTWLWVCPLLLSLSPPLARGCAWAYGTKSGRGRRMTVPGIAWHRHQRCVCYTTYYYYACMACAEAVDCDGDGDVSFVLSIAQSGPRRGSRPKNGSQEGLWMLLSGGGEGRGEERSLK